MPQHGPYLYQSDTDTARKVFTSDDGSGTRTFTIVRAYAFNAGIIGTEHNGVAVIDEDNREILFDKGHCMAETLQKQLFQQLVEADWATFTRLVRSNERFRGNAAFPDGTSAEPDYVRPLAKEDDWQVMDIKSEGPEDDPYIYPSQTRSEIIAELLTHPVHRDGYGPSRFAWNIKLHGALDISGKNHASAVAGNDFDAELDSAWDAHIESNDELFGDCACDALRMYMDGDYTVYPGINQGDYHFGVEGRSGGWLVLDRIDGVGKLHFQSMNDLEEQLGDLDKNELKKLYVAITQLDHELQPHKIVKAMEYQYAYARSSWEDEQRAERSVKPR